MKKLLILSSLALLVAPSFSSNISTDIAGGAIKYFADDTTSSSEAKNYTIKYNYNKTYSGLSYDGYEFDKLDDEYTTETIESGKTIDTSEIAYLIIKVNDVATRWDGNYKFLGWYMNTGSAFNFYGAITQDWELFAKWEKVSDSDEIKELKKSETKSSVYYEYSIESNGSYNISNIALRFGGKVKDTDDYFTGYLLEDHIKTYGIAYTTELPSGYDTLTDAMNAGASISGLRQKQTSVDGTKATEPKLVESGDNDYYMFNLVIQDVPATKIDTIVYARAFMILENEDMFYFTESHYSVKSIAEAYIADTTTYTGYSTEIQDTLTLLSKGQISGTVTHNA